MRTLLLITILLGSIGARTPQRVAAGFAHERAVYVAEPMYLAVPVITIENDVVTGFSLPPLGTLCEDVEVRGGPDVGIYEPLYTLRAGDVVELREHPKWANRDWVMIAPAEWIPLAAVCYDDSTQD